MGSQRPGHIDLGNSRQFDPKRLGAPSPRDVGSPRSGDVPPALSPLDAFAFHSSVLARKFEEENEGRRISRLPPLTIAEELSKRRQFQPPRSPSQDQDLASSARDQPAGGSGPQLENANNLKHRSFYPFVSAFDDAASIAETIEEDPAEEEEVHGFYGNDRSASPESIRPHNKGLNSVATSTPQHVSRKDSVPPPLAPRQDSGDSARHLAPSTLAPPRSPALNRPRSAQSSIRQVRYDSGDDYSDGVSILSDSNDHVRYDRKASANTASSRPRSPFSPALAHGRSPSLTSEHSFVGSGPMRKSQNFSRPMSPTAKQFESFPRASIEQQNQHLTADSPSLRPSFDVLSINESIDSPRFPPQHGPFAAANDPDNASLSDASMPNGAPSYIYAKYSLPRGRVLSRNSFVPEDFLAHKFEWEVPFRESNVVKLPPENTNSAPSVAAAVSRPPQPPPSSSSSGPQNVVRGHRGYGSLAVPSVPQASVSMTDIMNTIPGNPFVDEEAPPRRPSLDQVVGKRSMDALLPSRSSPKLPTDNRSPHGRKSSFSSTLAPFKADLHSRKASSGLQHEHKISSEEKRSGVPTLNGQKLAQRLENVSTPTPDQMTPEAHLAIGIECHENGSLQKSTYHLRLAARGGQPTAMLLYGMACRHGWGMRSNPTEAVSWLRKAVDTAGLEVADDEAFSRLSRLPEDGVNDVLTRKTHKAQLALAIYELGVSYLNGWGVGQDKALGLRCFEISGSWGDADALAEAGFCYAKGVGCKKDLMKAASLYRRAADKGISMTGNSWIYKDKYKAKEVLAADDRQSRNADRDVKEKKPRDKSRSRSIFGGKKKTHQPV